MRYLLVVVIGMVLSSCSIEKEIMKQAQYGNFTIFSDTSKIEFQVLMTPMEVKTIAEKRYYWYNDKQIHKTFGGYSGKLLHGTYVEYFKSGELKAKGKYLKGLKEGNWRTYHQGGNIESEVNYDDGDTVGIAKTFSIEGVKTEYHTAAQQLKEKIAQRNAKKARKRAEKETRKKAKEAKKAEKDRLKAIEDKAEAEQKAKEAAAKKAADEATQKANDKKAKAIKDKAEAEQKNIPSTK